MIRWPQFREARHVFCYLAMPDEVDTRAILEACAATGKTVSVPWIKGDAPEMFPCQFDPAVAVADTALGFQQPKELAPVTIPVDFAVIPGRAFDIRGGRLGRGKGYYDRFLLKTREDGGVLCALAFEIQIEEEVPCESHDVRMDLVVTEARVIAAGDECASGRSR